MSDQVDFSVASDSIKKNISFRGPNVYILACAILIASVGLNVNSIPVIIGAMLISPVMGPILGFGFGLGVRDNRLVRESLKNFAVMVSISIVVSALFFILSPLNPEKPTELLARTNPTLYDVLIALFGGFAGIIEISRKEKGTVLSGVAIATALMPPLCTVGYGISLLNFQYILGALYLFIINSIFIALATFATVKYLHYPIVEDGGNRVRMNGKAVAVIMVAIIVPSIISGVRMVKDSNFNINVKKIVESNRAIGQGFIYDYKIDNHCKPPVIELFMAGKVLDDAEKENIYSSAEKYGISRSQIRFRNEAARHQEQFAGSEVIKDIYERSDRQIQALTDTVAALRGQQDSLRSRVLPTEAVFRELQAQYPYIESAALLRGDRASSGDEGTVESVAVLIRSQQDIDSATSDRILRWLKVRLDKDDVEVIISTVN